jgi:hypothetical protein
VRAWFLYEGRANGATLAREVLTAHNGGEGRTDFTSEMLEFNRDQHHYFVVAPPRIVTAVLN